MTQRKRDEDTVSPAAVAFAPPVPPPHSLPPLSLSLFSFFLSPMSSSTEPSVKKAQQPNPWTHEETVNLIEAYQQKWYSRNRGQLKSPQWEEIAVTVAARCGYDFSHPSSKSALQCRHKMEKLRQRFRSHSHRLGPSSPWPYFHLMDRLLRGPLPISARPMDADDHLQPNDAVYEQPDLKSNDNGDVDDEDDDDEDESCYTKSRSINYILRRPTIVNRFAVGREKLGIGGEFVDDGLSRVFCEEPAAKRARNDGCDEKGRDESDLTMLRLAAEIRAFSERFVGMESMKMDMIKETERCRMEMESKRVEMILRSQHKIVDAIARAFGSSSSSPNRLSVAKEEA